MMVADRPYGYDPCFCGSLGRVQNCGKIKVAHNMPHVTGTGKSILPPMRNCLARHHYLLRFFVARFDCGAISFFCSHSCRVLFLVDKRSSNNGNRSSNNSKKYRSTTSHRSPSRSTAQYDDVDKLYTSSSDLEGSTQQSSQEQTRRAPPGRLQQ